MKHIRIILSLLILVLVLSGCAGASQERYEVSLDGNRVVSIHPDSGTIQYGSDIYRYKVKNTWDGTRYEFTYPNGQRYTWTESRKTGTSAWSEALTPSLYLPGDLLVKALKQPAPENAGTPREKKGNPVTGILCTLAGLLLMIFHKYEDPSGSGRKFVSVDGSYGVEVTKEGRAAATFVGGIFILIFGLLQFII